MNIIFWIKIIKINTLINIYPNLTNVNLVLKVKKPHTKLGFSNNLDLAKKLSLIIFLNLANFAQNLLY